MSKILIDQNALLLVKIDMHPKSTSSCKLAFEGLRQSKKKLRHALEDKIIPSVAE